MAVILEINKQTLCFSNRPLKHGWLGKKEEPKNMRPPCKTSEGLDVHVNNLF